MLFGTKKRQEEITTMMEICKVKNDLLGMKTEMDEHFHSINENTNEIDVQNSFLCEIDNRMNKMEERMDEIHFLLKQLVVRSSMDLSRDEQRVFLQLYTDDSFQCADQISDKAQMPREAVEESLTDMMEKGLPVEREILNSKVYFRLNREFKLRQAKENIIKIDPEITGQFQNTLLQQFFT